MNGLSGRMLRLPSTNSKRKKEFLIIYGHHSSLERLAGMAEYLAQYGNVTVPDLPGFGGMDSFYAIGRKPTLDDMADYLASFIKLRYKKKKITLVGVSYGFLVVTKLLQKYPDLSGKVKVVISLAGFAHKDDFRIKRHNYWLLSFTSVVFSGYLSSKFLQNVVFSEPILRLGYRFVEPKLVDDGHTKIRQAEELEREKRINFELHLWKINDARTYSYVAKEMFKVNLCSVPVALPVYHVAADGDRYFDNLAVEQHLRTIYTDVTLVPLNHHPHSTSVVATAEEAEKFFTAQMKALLRK